MEKSTKNVTDRLLFSGFVTHVLPLCAVVAVLIANYLSFCVAPDERVMGAVQRVFYYHVGAAMSCYLLIGALFTGSVGYLATRDRVWDRGAEAAGSVAFLLCTIVLLSGMIWGHSAWNTWWRWEPRLVSFLALWLLLFSYIVLRMFTRGDDRAATFAAVLGILASVDVPIVMFSIRLLSRAEQLHPEVVSNQGLRDERFVYALIAAITATVFLSAWLLLVKFLNLTLRERLLEAERAT